jgi:dCTP deaminase
MGEASGMFLSGDNLKTFVQENEIISAPKDAPKTHVGDLFDNICYELTVGGEIYISSLENPLSLKDRQSVTIKPGDYAMIITAETLRFPLTKMGLVSMKFRYTGYGLINVSGFHVDPGFKGNFIFTVFNAGPASVTVRRLEPMFMLFIVDMSSEVEEYKGDHQEQTNIPTEMMTALAGPSVSLKDLVDRVSILESYNKVFLGLAGGLIAALIATIIAIKRSVP